MIQLTRILGNDVPYRHGEGQTTCNLQFILDNEYEFEGCRKTYLLNRIYKPEVLDGIIRLLRSRQIDYDIVPFEESEYRNLTDEGRWRYLTNVNGARNHILTASREEIIAPLDGNCFFSLEGFLRFQSGLEYGRGYSAILMARVNEYPDEETQPNWTETYRYGNKVTTGKTEPQLAFMEGYDKQYDESVPYSIGSKVSLLYQIGVRGVWDNWYPALRSKAILDRSVHYGKACGGGFCFRLPSGVPEAEADNQLRGRLRSEGLKQLVKDADKLIG